MGSRLRMFEPDVVFNITLRAIDRQFVFTPNHRQDNPLLHKSCPANALDLSNNIIPIPSTINVIGSSISRALINNPVNLHAFESSSNHIHQLISADEENLKNIVGFEQHANSLIARGMNRILKREGHLFVGSYRMEACVDDESAEQKLFYALTNVAKDNLVEKVSHSPFFSTFKHQANGKALRYWYLDWQSYWQMGGDRNKKIRPKDFIKWVTFQTTPLPAWIALSEHQRQTKIRRSVKAIEAEQARLRQGFGAEARPRVVIGVDALFARNHRDRAEDPKQYGAQPLCHSATREGYFSYRNKFRDFQNEFIKASWDYRMGFWEREFPEGSYRPPIVRPYTNDEH